MQDEQMHRKTKTKDKLTMIIVLKLLLMSAYDAVHVLLSQDWLYQHNYISKVLTSVEAAVATVSN